MSSPGLKRATASSAAVVTAIPIDIDQTSQSVSSTFVSAGKWRSKKGTTTAIIMTNVEATALLMVLSA